VLSRQILVPAAVVVLGAITTVLDATIVNVALPTLGQDLHASIATIQWVPTIYLLAFAAVIPLSGWAAGRFGAKRVWIASLALFLTGSVLAGLAPSVGALIGFRVVQGLGGGMIMPLGQSILAHVAGPKRMGRVMSIIGVPMLLMPIFGPLIGGALISAASWRWIFFVNLPVGAAAIAAAVALLPADGPRRSQRLDVRGVVLLSGGLATFLYGLAETSRHAQPTAPGALLPMLAGALLVALFIQHALRVPQPLIDLRLFRNRGFTAGTLVNLVVGTALFGVALLLPLYYEIVRGRSPLDTGLLLAPQGVGAAASISLAGYLTDRIGARRVVPAGIALALAGTGWYTQVGAHSSYAATVIALLLVGAGLGATVTPAMAAAFQGLAPAEMGQATSAVNVVQRVAGALGSALLAVVLQHAMTSRLPGLHGGIGQAGAVAAASPHAAHELAGAFGVSFAVAFGICLLALLPSGLLPRRDRKEPTMSPNGGRPQGGAAQARLFRIVNVVMRALLGLPVRTPLSARLMLVHHIGRKTGKHYRQPVSYVRHGHVLLTPGGGTWTRNLRADHPVRLRIGGKDVTARAELIADPAEVQRLLQVMAAANPALHRFIPIPTTPDGRFDPESLANAIAYGFRIVSWHVEPGRGSGW
jgi:EmrB/QacA subfamily drug resistance transporter/deazaflavin-dependent oxidoreductase (nitroreductase family)